MFVIEKKQHLVLPYSPAVCSSIPHALPFDLEGSQFIAVKHGLEETRVLRNMGVQAPAPILHYYNWPGRFAPMQHQRETSAFLTVHPHAICLNSPGTGKTLSVLWAADYLLLLGLIKRVLIIAPLSTLKPVWGKEIAHHFTHRRSVVVIGEREKKRALLQKTDAEFTIINHDGFSAIPPECFAGFDLVVYDEATALKSPTTRRFKRFIRYTNDYDPWLWLLTGTPITQAPTDAWSLAKLVRSNDVPRSFTKFKELTMYPAGPFKWLPRADALDICKKVMQPSIRFSLEQCIDLPKQVYIEHTCELTQHQQVAYTEMRDEAMVAAAGISAANAAVVIFKLLQICCGVAYKKDGSRVYFDDKPRVNLLLDLIAEIGDKVVVVVPLRGVQDHLVEVLTKNKHDVAYIHGGVNKTKRYEIFDQFQNSDKIQVLVAHPRTTSHGVDLTRSKNMIWYSPLHSLETYEQTNDRIRRLSSTKGARTVVHHILATPFERGIYRRLQHSKKVLTDFLTLVMGENE